MSRGRITRYLTVWCARCPFWEHLEASVLQLAEKEAQGMGWKKIKYTGWVCPACLEGV